MQKILGKTITEYEVLKFLASDEPLADALAEQLEIQADGGDSPGAFLRDSADMMLKEKAVRSAERRLARTKAAREHPND